MLSNLNAVSLATGGLIALIVAIPVALAIGALVALLVYKKSVEKKIGDSRSEASRIMEEARMEAKTLLTAIRSNFKGYEELQKKLREEAPKMGATFIAKLLFDAFTL